MTTASRRQMKALTLRHPWPFAIVALGKRIENRRWRPSPGQLAVGDWFAIHGGVMPKSDDLLAVKFKAAGLIERFREQADAWMAAKGLDDITIGTSIMTGIVAVCQFGGIVTASEDPWFEGPIGWRIDNVVALPEPVPCKGAQGLWDVPEDVLPLVREQFKKGRAATAAA